jgi:hypothetical protein
MTRYPRTLLGIPAIIAAAATSTAQPAPAPVVPPSIGVTVIRNANVVPMDRERVLKGQTIVVTSGVITALDDAAKVRVPSGARVIDAQGRYVLPGLFDMHAHLQQGPGTINDAAGRQLALFIAYGITAARILAGPPTSIALRDSTARGRIVGPRIIAFSPSINGNSLKSANVADSMIAAFKAAGFDGLKTHGGFDAVTYDSVVAAANRHGLKLSGHVTPGYGLRRAMAANQQIEHLDGFLQELLSPSYSGPPLGQIVFDKSALDAVDTVRIRPLAREFASRGLWNGPTLALFETVSNDSTPEQLLARPNMQFIAPTAATGWTNQRRQALTNPPPREARQLFIDLRRQIVRELDAAGAKLLVGSDSPQAFMTPGDAVHRELEAFVAAGLTPFRALVAATRNPAEYLGIADSSGTVAVGKRADLLMIPSNPLDRIGNVRTVVGVMSAGRWYDSTALEAIRTAVRSRVK